jgi:hypothetical protein
VPQNEHQRSAAEGYVSEKEWESAQSLDQRDRPSFLAVPASLENKNAHPPLGKSSTMTWIRIIVFGELFTRLRTP